MARNGYDADFLAELKNKCDIIDIISGYMPLEQKGRNFWGRCPFHHEKTASFCINREEQFYHCFGCGKSGDVITFIMEFEALDFMEAVKLLANKVHMPLPDFNYDSEKVKEAKERKETLLSILNDTAHFYYNNLKTGKADNHLEYMYNRGFTKDTIQKFGIGASVDYYSLPSFLLDKGYKQKDILLAGVCSEKDGRLYDFEGGRLIIPIINIFNQVIAFGGRVLGKTDFAKYKNTAETEIFIKNKTLFNINNLKKLKNEKGLKNVIMVEGYMDTIALYSAGFENVVASMGTSLTKEQARLLKRYTDTVIISYDGDSAGQKATMRGLEILADEGLNVRVVSLPDGLDPDDVIKNMGKDAYAKLLDEALPLIDFKLKAVKDTYDVTKTEDKRRYLSESVEVIRNSNNEIEREQLLKKLSRDSGITYESLRRQLEKEPTEKKRIQPIIIEEKQVGDKIVQAQRYILQSMLLNKEYTKNCDIDTIEFEGLIHKEIAKYISEERKAKKLCKINVLYDILSEEYIAELDAIAGLGMNESFKETEKNCFDDCVVTLTKHNYSKKITALKKMADEETDINKRRSIVAELADLIARSNRM